MPGVDLSTIPLSPTESSKRAKDPKNREGEFSVAPFTVLIDQREGAPWSFSNIRVNAEKAGPVLVVPTEVVHLPTGDYTIKGLEGCVAVERKSPSDAYGSFGGGRDRFEAELERLNRMEIAAVIIEADWNTLLLNPPAFTKMRPKSVFMSILAWSQRYPRVHWFPMPNRVSAEHTCFWFLNRFFLDATQGRTRR